MRINKIGLNNFLHRINFLDTKLYFCKNKKRVSYVAALPQMGKFKKLNRGKEIKI